MNTVIEQNFEGEEMKIPKNMPTVSAAKAAHKNPINAVILIILSVVLVAIFAGLGYWYHLVMNTPIVEPLPLRPTPTMNNEPESTTAEARTATMDVVSTSDELEAIEADVASTNLDNLDVELNAIDAELEAALNVNF